MITVHSQINQVNTPAYLPPFTLILDLPPPRIPSFDLLKHSPFLVLPSVFFVVLPLKSFQKHTIDETVVTSRSPDLSWILTCVAEETR
jgi:hypothetical protein